MAYSLVFETAVESFATFCGLYYVLFVLKQVQKPEYIYFCDAAMCIKEKNIFGLHLSHGHPSTWISVNSLHKPKKLKSQKQTKNFDETRQRHM